MPGNTFYVAKTGNDTNDGLSWATAKKSIQAAVNLCPLTNTANPYGDWGMTTQVDTIKIRPGVYPEQVEVGNKHIALVGVDFMDNGGGVGKGRVILDGEDLRPYCITKAFGTFGYTRFEGIELRRAQTRLLSNAGGTWNTEWYDCELHSAPEVLWGLNVRMYRCLIRDFRTNTANGVMGQFVVNRGEYGTQWWYDCTFANGPATKPMLHFDRVYPKLFRCVFVKCPWMIDWYDGQIGSDIDFNGYDFVSGKMTRNNPRVDVLSLADWKAYTAGGVHDVNSVSINPATDIADAEMGLWSPTLTGVLATASELGVKIGALHPGFGMSVNRNAAHYNTPGAVYTNTEQRPNGNIVLVDGEQVGTWTSAVIDLGDFYRLYGVRIADILERYPTDVVDADIDDVPNAHNFEYRFSRLSSADCTSQAWRKVERCSAGQICFNTAIHARWVQIRISLRTNGIDIG